MSTIEGALEHLRAGRPIVIPTDTIYGLAVLPSVPGAVNEIYRIKGRPAHKPIPVLGTGFEMLDGVVIFGSRARRLADRFWPGPLTMVLPRTMTFAADLGGTGVQEDVAVRVPAHDLCLELLRHSGPLAVTSANLSGREPATTVERAREALDDEVDVFLDGGPCAGEPSTVVRVNDDLEIIRDGAIALEELQAAFER